MEAIQYKGYTIQEDGERYMKGYIFFPTSEGIQHDYDLVGEDYKYCGNCKWADTIEDAKDEISEKIMTSLPDHKVKMNGREYSFPWIDDALRFAEFWKGHAIEIEELKRNFL